MYSTPGSEHYTVHHLAVYFSLTRYSAAHWKSVRQFCSLPCRPPLDHLGVKCHKIIKKITTLVSETPRHINQHQSEGLPFTVLPASPHIGDGHDAEVLDEEVVHHAAEQGDDAPEDITDIAGESPEVGSEADAEAPVAVEKAGRGGIRHEVLPHADEHGDLRTVLEENKMIPSRNKLSRKDNRQC